MNISQHGFYQLFPKFLKSNPCFLSDLLVEEKLSYEGGKMLFNPSNDGNESECFY